MRLHRLEITAFGPFADTVVVDFDAVGVNGLFLVHGPTGAGKTSLLDAVCFALYAGVPGARPGGRALRSDHAPGEAVPRVSLEFGVAARRFRVTRSPEFLRPKRRGTGSTKAPAAVVLEEQAAGRWRAVSARADEVGELVTEVLGMGLDQFSKVVLLPQGEFAAFLRATADERRSLLEKLFDISTYAGVESWLVDARRELVASVAASRAVLATDLARMEDVLAALPADAVGDVRSAGDLDPAGLDTVGRRLETYALECLTASGQADGAAASVQTELLRVSALARCQNRGRAATQTLAAFEADRGRWATLRDTVAAADRALAVAGDLRAVVRARDRMASAGARAGRAREPLARHGSADWTRRDVTGWLASLDEQGVALSEAEAAAGRLRSEGEALRERARAARGASIAVDRVRREVTLALDAVSAAEAGLRRLESLLARRSATLEQRTRWSRVRSLAREVAGAETELAALRERLTGAREAEQDAREAFLEAQQARIAGMAGELAAGLVDGAPCVVCGGLDHPDPAVRTSVSDGAAEIRTREQVWTKLRERLGVLQTESAAVGSLLAARTSDLAQAWAELPAAPGQRRVGSTVTGDDRHLDGGLDDGSGDDAADDAAGDDAFADTGPGVGVDRSGLTDVGAVLICAEAEVVNAEAELAVTEHSLALVKDVETQLGAARGRHQDAVTALEQAERSVASSAAALAEVRHRVDETEQEVARLRDEHRRFCPCALPDDPSGPSGSSGPFDPSGPTDLAGHGLVRTRVVELGEALDELAATTAEVEAVEVAVRKALSSNGFAAVEEAVAALLDADDLHQLRRQVRALDERQAAARATLAEPEVEAALAEPAGDPEAARVAVDTAQAAARYAGRAQLVAETAARSFATIREALVVRMSELVPLEARAADLGPLADTVNGVGDHNSMRMRLSAYVLAARLEKVAALANERLQVMGDGRYRLAHTDALASGGRRSGLGLVVQDQWTGQVRDTASLSGGESFMASLALALGLADAVREEAGGFDLNTLFIDEGFGTLDEESLEQVMTVLDGLRDGGRCVGVVSHVSDLRFRVPAQIRVDKTSTGSSITVLGVGATSPAA